MAWLEHSSRIRSSDGAEEFAQRLDGPMAILGLLFALVVLGQMAAQDARVVVALSVLGWVLWFVFAGEFILRAYLAQDRRAFWTRNWWQLVFLALPFLRFVRLLVALRAARVSAVVGAAVRGSRSSGRLLTSRVWWLCAVTLIVVLSSSQLLYTLGSFSNYADALHAAALATVSGEPLGTDDGFARVMEIVLAAYSVVVFATIAAAVGAYFVGTLRGREPQSETPPSRTLSCPQPPVPPPSPVRVHRGADAPVADRDH